MLVVLPAPLGPMNPNTSPRRTENDSRSTALVDPNTRDTLSKRMVTSPDEVSAVVEVLCLIIFTMNQVQLKFVFEGFDQRLDRRVGIDDSHESASFLIVDGVIDSRGIGTEER